MLEAITPYIQQFGYWVIIFVVFFGIIGIPAPEETFMILIGALIAEQNLDFVWAICAVLLGSNAGMLLTYLIGRRLGTSFIEKYGYILKITPERWMSMQRKFDRNDEKVLILGYFLPGLRQLSPYISGTRGLPLPKFYSLAFVGSLLWTTIYMTIGYYFGNVIGLKYLSLLAVIFALIFIVSFVSKSWFSSERNKVSSRIRLISAESGWIL